MKIPGVEVFVEPVKEHRFVVVFRGKGLGGHVHDTDPQRTGVPPLEPVPSNPDSAKTAEVAREFRQAGLRDPQRPSESERPDAARRFRQTEFAELRRGLRPEGGRDRRLPDVQGPRPAGRHGDRRQGANARRADDGARSRTGAKYDFFFIHFKYTDSTGEDGNFAAKVKRTEEFDAAVPRITALKPDVLIVTGDHSTPSMLASHSWHPVPTLLVAKNCRTDACQKFGETECLRGGLGQFEAKYLMSLALANAGRLGKFGA